jgi:hypothetical protein
MISESKVRELRAQADSAFRELVTKIQEIVGTINSLEQALQTKRAEHAQLVPQIVDAQAVLAAFNTVLGPDTPPVEVIDAQPVAATA